MDFFKKKSKAKKILNYLLKGHPLTPLKALKKFGVYRLSSVIYRLRRKGYSIETRIIEGKEHYAQYKIVREL